MTDIEKVRLKIGDLGTPPLLTDAQIQFFLDDNGGDVDAAAGDAAVALAFYFSTRASQTTGRMSIDFNAQAANYREMAVQFGADGTELGPAYTGGLVRSEIQASRDQTDLVQPSFTRDLHDDPQQTESDASDRRIYP